MTTRRTTNDSPDPWIDPNDQYDPWNIDHPALTNSDHDASETTTLRKPINAPKPIEAPEGAPLSEIFKARFGARVRRTLAPTPDDESLMKLLNTIAPTTDEPEKKDLKYWKSKRFDGESNIDTEVISRTKNGTIEFTSLENDEIQTAIQASLNRSINLLDLRDPGTQIPKTIDEWNALQPICILRQGHDALNQALGEKLAAEILENGTGLIIFEKAPNEHEAFEEFKRKIKAFKAGKCKENEFLDAYEAYTNAYSKKLEDHSPIEALSELFIDKNTPGLSEQTRRSALFATLKFCRNSKELTTIIQQIAETYTQDAPIEEPLVFDAAIGVLIEELANQKNYYYLTMLFDAMDMPEFRSYQEEIIDAIEDEEIARVLRRNLPEEAEKALPSRQRIINTVIPRLIKVCGDTNIETVDIVASDKKDEDDYMDYYIGARIVEKLHEALMRKQLGTAKGRRFISEAESEIMRAQQERILRQMGRPAKDEEIVVDRSEAEQIALDRMLQTKSDSSAATALQDMYTSLSDDEKSELITKEVAAYYLVKPLLKPTSMLAKTSYQRYDCRIMHNVTLIKWVNSRTLSADSIREANELHNMIEEMKEGELSYEVYMTMIEHAAIKIYEDIIEEKGSAFAQMYLPGGKRTLKKALRMLNSNTQRGKQLQSEIKDLNLRKTTATLKAITEILDIDMRDEMYDNIDLCIVFEAFANKLKGPISTNDRAEIERLVYTELPKELARLRPDRTPATSTHTRAQKDEVIDTIICIAKEDGNKKTAKGLYSYLWNLTQLCKGETLLDADILDSPLTPAICIIKVAMEGIEGFTDIPRLRAEMEKRIKFMAKATSESLRRQSVKKHDSLYIPENLPLKLAEIRQAQATEKEERAAIIELDLLTHQTPYAA